MIFLVWLGAIVVLLAVVAAISSLIMRRAGWDSIPFDRVLEPSSVESGDDREITYPARR
jgi:hypothetical protein